MPTTVASSTSGPSSSHLWDRLHMSPTVLLNSIIYNSLGFGLLEASGMDKAIFNAGDSMTVNSLKLGTTASVISSVGAGIRKAWPQLRIDLGY